MFKRFLTVFLMVLGLGLTSTLQAQDYLGEPGKTVQVNEVTAMADITQEIVSLKSSLQNLTPGSTDYVDATRRIETFGVAVNVLQSGETVSAAYSAATNHLYKKVVAKETELPQLQQIEITLHDLTNN